MNSSAPSANDAGPTSRSSLLLEIAAVLTLFAASFAALPLSDVIGGSAFVHGLALLRMAALVLLCTVLLRRTGQSWSDVGLRRPQSWWRTAGLVVGGYAAVGLLQFGIMTMAARSGQPANDLSIFADLRGNLAEYLFFAGPMALLSAAFGEEMVARGYLLNRFAQLIGTQGRSAWWTAAVAQALLFGIAHAYQGVTGIILISGVGLVFGAIYLLGGRNLWACIILHGLIDFVGITAIYLRFVPGL